MPVDPGVGILSCQGPRRVRCVCVITFRFHTSERIGFGTRLHVVCKTRPPSRREREIGYAGGSIVLRLVYEN